MHQALIFGSMLTTGLALFGTAAWIQADRSAFTSPAPEFSVPIVHTTVSALKPEVIEAAPAEPAVELPAVKITGRRSAAQVAATSTKAVAPLEPPLATAPCSPWQEIGPERVNDGTAIGVRRVRQLCATP